MIMKTNYTGIVFKKEIIDILRDKKTLFTSILLPLVIFPIIALAMGMGMSDMIDDESKPVPVAITGNMSGDFYKYLSSSKELEIKASENADQA